MADQNDNSSYVVGKMDIREQQKTMAGFLRMTTWVCVLSILVLIFLALTNA